MGGPSQGSGESSAPCEQREEECTRAGGQLSQVWAEALADQSEDWASHPFSVSRRGRREEGSCFLEGLSHGQEDPLSFSRRDGNFPAGPAAQAEVGLGPACYTGNWGPSWGAPALPQGCPPWPRIRPWPGVPSETEDEPRSVCSHLPGWFHPRVPRVGSGWQPQPPAASAWPWP